MATTISWSLMRFVKVLLLISRRRVKALTKKAIVKWMRASVTNSRLWSGTADSWPCPKRIKSRTGQARPEKDEEQEWVNTEFTWESNLPLLLIKLETGHQKEYFRVKQDRTFEGLWHAPRMWGLSWHGLHVRWWRGRSLVCWDRRSWGEEGVSRQCSFVALSVGKCIYVLNFNRVYNSFRCQRSFGVSTGLTRSRQELQEQNALVWCLLSRLQKSSLMLFLLGLNALDLLK